MCKWKARGKSRLDYADSVIYLGYFSKGLIHGEGTLILPSEEIYEADRVYGQYPEIVKSKSLS